jgi:hypothetical protein
MDDSSRMPFCKFEGFPMKEVPAAYLDWLHDQAWITKWPEVLDYIETNRDVIDYEL